MSMSITGLHLSQKQQKLRKLLPGKNYRHICKHKQGIIFARLVIFNPEDVQIKKSLGSIGVMNIQSNPKNLINNNQQQKPGFGGFDEGLSLQDIQEAGKQQISETGIECQLYGGKITQGYYAGTEVILKSYPPARFGSQLKMQTDALAANELHAHALIQPPVSFKFCPQIAILLGGFETAKGVSAGEQFLVYLNEGTITLDEYAKLASEAGSRNESVVTDSANLRVDFWSVDRILSRRKRFIKKIMRSILEGLAFMHSRRLLHQSLGPRSVVLSSGNEKDWETIKVKLQDLAFAVDVSDEALFGGLTLGEIWDSGKALNKFNSRSKTFEELWHRAAKAEAENDIQKRNFGYVDDTYSAGLLFAYIAFVALSQPESIDGVQIRKLIESTFLLDLEGFREYCLADDRWSAAVEFLDENSGQGWDLLKNMLSSNWKSRPTPAACVNHPFFGGNQNGSEKIN